MNQPGRMQIADLRAQNLAIGNAFASQSAICNLKSFDL
jgi:hypothetical protein